MVEKKFNLAVFRNNNSGIILIVALWVLVILVILAVTLGRNARVELALTRNSLAKIKANYLARAGIVFALEQLRVDSASQEYNDNDNLYYCGFSPEESQEPQDVYDNVLLGEGSFTVSYVYQETEEGDERKRIFGLQDEERKVNLNAINLTSVNVLISLIKQLGYSESMAQTIAYSVADWIDADNIVSHATYGAEDEFYEDEDLAYKPKNAPFDSLEELRFVRGVDEDVYKGIKEYLTIYPKKATALKINFETASENVLLGLAKSVSGAQTNTDEDDAESLVEKMLDYRRGDDGILATADDQQVEQAGLGLNTKEQVIFLSINPYRTKVSNFFRIQSKGVVKDTKVTSNIEAVVSREDHSVVGWRRK